LLPKRFAAIVPARDGPHSSVSGGGRRRVSLHVSTYSRYCDKGLRLFSIIRRLSTNARYYETRKPLRPQRWSQYARGDPFLFHVAADQNVRTVSLPLRDFRRSDERKVKTARELNSNGNTHGGSYRRNVKDELKKPTTISFTRHTRTFRVNTTPAAGDSTVVKSFRDFFLLLPRSLPNFNSPPLPRNIPFLF